MWFHGSRYPSLLVEDNATVTIGMDNPELTIVPLRPLTTAALLIMGGIPTSVPARLSDARAFEKLESADGYVDIKRPGPDGRIGGYTSSFLRHVLTRLDPTKPVPATIEWQSQAHPVTQAGNQSGDGRRPRNRNVGMGPGITSTRISVPGIFLNNGVISLVPIFDNIVVGFGATLYLGADVTHLGANNFICYEGSTIKSDSTYLAVDVEGTLAGSVQSIVHEIVGEELAINFAALAGEAFTGA